MPRTQSERLWVVGAAVVALLMTVVGYFLLIGPQRTRTAAVRADVDAASFETTTMQARITNLTAQSRRIATYRAALAQAQQALPTADDLTATPRLLRTLAGTAAATGTTVTSLTVGDPVAFTPATTAPAAGTATTTGSSGTTTGSSGTAAATPATAPLSTIALGATVTGTMAHLDQFLADLQNGQPRALLVSAVTLSGAGTHTTSMNLTMSAFVRPATPGSTPGH